MANLSQQELYERLNILDAKCTSLLQVCAVLAVLQSIPVAAADTPPWIKPIAAASVLVFLLVSFMAVSVLAVNWKPSKEDIDKRTQIYTWCRRFTWLGLVFAGLFVVAALIATF